MKAWGLEMINCFRPFFLPNFLHFLCCCRAAYSPEGVGGYPVRAGGQWTDAEQWTPHSERRERGAGGERRGEGDHDFARKWSRILLIDDDHFLFLEKELDGRGHGCCALQEIRSCRGLLS